MASNSLSNALYFFSVTFSFLEKNAIGAHAPLMVNCSSLPPIATPDASVVTLVSAEGDGWWRRVASASNFFAASKAMSTLAST